MDYFINRDEEIQAFKDALDDLFAGVQKTTVLLYHGASGMGKTWLLQQCLRIAREDKRRPVTIHVDCNRANMTLEVLFNEIHTALEDDFKKYYTAYIEFLEKIDDIEDQVDEEGKVNSENAQKVASVVSAVATKVVVGTVPGVAVVGEENLGKAAGLVAGGIAEGITSLRSKFARKKLDREKYRLFLKDLQAERTKKLATILNTIAEENNQKIILCVDRFEKFAITPNPKSDLSYYQYWRKDFVNKLSPNILLLQCGRMDLEGDFQLHLPNHRVRSFRLKAFTPRDIARILSQLQILQQQMQKYKQFVKFVFEKTQGYPVAMGLLKGNLQTLQTTGELERTTREILAKETNIIEHSIRWFLDNNLDPKQRETVYKLAICCAKSGKINRKAIEYIFGKTEMSFPEVEAALRQLSQQYSFIDCIQWTMHELAREFILRHLKKTNVHYLREIYRDVRDFYEQVAKQAKQG